MSDAGRFWCWFGHHLWEQDGRKHFCRRGCGETQGAIPVGVDRYEVVVGLALFALWLALVVFFIVMFAESS